MTKRTRRKFSPTERMAILKKHLVEGQSVSEVYDAHGLNPTQFYRWQKELFENGVAVFVRTDKRTEAVQQRRQAELEAKSKKKDSVIAEIMEELIAKKTALGVDERGVGGTGSARRSSRIYSQSCRTHGVAGSPIAMVVRPGCEQIL